MAAENASHIALHPDGWPTGAEKLFLSYFAAESRWNSSTLSLLEDLSYRALGWPSSVTPLEKRTLHERVDLFISRLSYIFL